jgi:hypothetical protein
LHFGLVGVGTLFHAIGTGAKIIYLCTKLRKNYGRREIPVEHRRRFIKTPLQPHEEINLENLVQRIQRQAYFSYTNLLPTATNQLECQPREGWRYKKYDNIFYSKVLMYN